ncbi:MAG: NAD(P)/FAD-dependent oxidoreductase [Acidimicrobiia bacterium]|nr:MAG: NAD(P)/FAD-dependent oxidoreductase [Acidimicrobiia bacterium]
MASIGIIGDGPGGLSAALFLAKNGHQATVYGQDKTAMNFAHLTNYLGIPEISGTEFQRVARQQVLGFGAILMDEEVTAVSTGDGFTVSTASAETTFDYLILTEGKNPAVAGSLNLEVDEGGAIEVDRDSRSSMDRVYVVGRSARPERSQAIISAGAGASAALDILAAEAGKNVTDWDSPSDD